MDFIGKHRGWFAWMSLRRAVYTWTGYWSFDREYLKEEPLDPPNVFLRTTLTILMLLGLRRLFRENTGAGFSFRRRTVLLSGALLLHACESGVYLSTGPDSSLYLRSYFLIGRKQRSQERAPEEAEVSLQCAL